jgi:cytochrome b561
MSTARYNGTAIALHWLIAALVLTQIALGWWMIDIPKSPPGVRASWFNVHKSIGLTIGLLVLFRVYWRLTRGAPPLPPHLPRWQRIAARTSHALLYASMLVMPISGYLGSSFTKYPIVFYGMRLPHWGWDSPAAKELMSQIHYAAVIVFMMLIALHAAAALKHLLVARDGVFQRMWPRRGEKDIAAVAPPTVSQ